MPATTPERIHRLFENRFNAGDLDGLMELYEPDAALIAKREGGHPRGGRPLLVACRLVDSQWPLFSVP